MPLWRATPPDDGAAPAQRCPFLRLPPTAHHRQVNGGEQWRRRAGRVPQADLDRAAPRLGPAIVSGVLLGIGIAGFIDESVFLINYSRRRE
jgi:hypothetical protein